MAQKDNKPLQIRPSRPLINRLDALATRFKRESANQLAVEIIRDCIAIWEEAAQAAEDVYSKHREEALALKDAMLKGTLYDAKAESTTTPAAKRKTR
jgi:hypothetical protein